MTQKIRSAIIGTGFMGQVHSRAVHAAGGVVSRGSLPHQPEGPAAAELFGAAGRTPPSKRPSLPTMST